MRRPRDLEAKLSIMTQTGFVISSRQEAEAELPGARRRMQLHASYCTLAAASEVDIDRPGLLRRGDSWHCAYGQQVQASWPCMPDVSQAVCLRHRPQSVGLGILRPVCPRPSRSPCMKAKAAHIQSCQLLEWLPIACSAEAVMPEEEAEQVCDLVGSWPQ